MKDYQYPLAPDWTTTEIIDVMKFFEMIEKAYEDGVQRQELLEIYRRFKEIVPSQAEEKTICREFEEISNYSAYQVLKIAKNTTENRKIKM
jgi:uncharacterized protein YktA (UPF0223 family)